MDTPGIPLSRKTITALLIVLVAQLELRSVVVQDTITTLQVGTAVERELAGGESHAYEIALAAGEYFRAIVDQRGINVIVTLYGADGKKIADLNRPIGAHGPEPVSLVADTPGAYRIVLRPAQKTLPAGRYALTIEARREATNDDRTRVAAERVLAEGTQLAAELTAESLRKAIDKYAQTIPMWRSLADRQQEVFTLTAIGYTHSHLSENQQAIDYFNRALALSRTSGDVDGESMALYSLGVVYGTMGDQGKALDAYLRALPLQRAAGTRAMEASTLGSIGSVYLRAGDHPKALDYYQQALALKRSVGDPQGEATLLNNIGFLYSTSGEPQSALEFYSQSLPILRRLNNPQEEAITLNNIAVVYDDLGELERALELYMQVAEIKRIAGNRAEEAIALNNAGRVHHNLSNHHKALEFHERSLALSEAAGTRSTQAVSLGNIGRAYHSLGERRTALEYYDRALAIQREIGERRGEATTLTNMGRAYDELRDHPRAMGIFREALAIRRAIGDASGEAVTLYSIARAERDQDDLDEAYTHFDAARRIVEAQRTKVANQGLRTSYLATVRRYYELGIDVLMRLHAQHPGRGFDETALRTSESSRALGLLELLAEARADIRQGVSGPVLERERSLQRQLDTKAAAQTRLLSGKHTAEQAAAMANEIDGLVAAYEEVKGQIRQNSPRYAGLTQPAAPTLQEIQHRILDEETLLLEYAVGDETSYLWAVTRTTIHSFKLPARAEVDAAARRVYDLLNARNQRVPNETPEVRQRRIDAADSRYPAAAADLSQMLLGPVASLLGRKRLAIVADGSLQYVPFAALPIPASNVSKLATYTPLVEAHEVVNVPSISVLSMLRQERPAGRTATKTVAVFADPVFYADDPRVAGVSRKPPPRAKHEVLPDAVSRSATESGLGDFVRLRFSRQEAEQITRLVPESRKLMAVDFAASRSAATSGELEDYAIVHFATHGLVNSRHPELSGIVLSLVDDRGRAQDGFLRLHEIYNLRLSADLAVLSACQTALGKEIKGEGLVGLTRGFMYAGAPRVVASLWQIDDQATAVLMQRFYHGMLTGKLTAAAALRAAQVAMAKDNRWASPHYWAAFTLQGEWR